MAIEQFIDNELKGTDVVLFMKGTPQFPMCGFSGQVVQILDHIGVAYKGINILESDDLRQGMLFRCKVPLACLCFSAGHRQRGRCSPLSRYPTATWPICTGARAGRSKRSTSCGPWLK